MTNLALVEEEQDRWHVQLANGVVCQMTLDLLDDAFQDGVVSVDTFVCQDGERASGAGWVTFSVKATTTTTPMRSSSSPTRTTTKSSPRLRTGQPPLRVVTNRSCKRCPSSTRPPL